MVSRVREPTEISGLNFPTMFYKIAWLDNCGLEQRLVFISFSFQFVHSLNCQCYAVLFYGNIHVWCITDLILMAIRRYENLFYMYLSRQDRFMIEKYQMGLCDSRTRTRCIVNGVSCTERCRYLVMTRAVIIRLSDDLMWIEMHDSQCNRRFTDFC